MNQNQRNGRRSALAIVALILLIAFAVGLWLLQPAISTPSTAATQQPASSGQINQNLLNEAQKIIDQNYVDRSAVQQQALTYGAIQGMVQALGDTGHSRFLTPDDVKQERSLTTGSFEGIGATVEMRDGRVTIVAPIDGSPAQKAGLKPGDVMVAVNGKSTDGQTLQQVVNQVLGPAGSQVRITILRPSTNKTFDVTITRAKIALHNVTWHQLPGTTLAHLRIAEFSQGVSDDLKQALQQIQDQHLTGIVLDLRNNPGGLLDEAVVTASDFLTKGDVLLERDAKGNISHVPVKPQPIQVDTPMVVLINQGSASASEIVSGAIQDAHRAQLVGETTFGTGTVLNQFPLSDGSALLLATQEWLTPSGRVIWHHGIQPDQAVTLPSSANPVLPEQEQDMTASQLQSSGDVQLLKAVSILGAPGK